MMFMFVIGVASVLGVEVMAILATGLYLAIKNNNSER